MQVLELALGVLLVWLLVGFGFGVVVGRVIAGAGAPPAERAARLARVAPAGGQRVPLWRSAGALLTAGAGLVALAGAASAGMLPDAAQTAVRTVIRTVTPFEAPEPGGGDVGERTPPADQPAGRAPAATDGPVAPGTPAPSAQAPVPTASEVPTVTASPAPPSVEPSPAGTPSAEPTPETPSAEPSPSQPPSPTPSPGPGADGPDDAASRRVVPLPGCQLLCPPDEHVAAPHEAGGAERTRR